MARTLTLPFSGTKLRTLRETKGLFQTDLAEACTAAGQPLDYSRISRYETGRTKPTPPILLALANALDVDVADLLDEVA